jgi:hypothetical protein
MIIPFNMGFIQEVKWSSNTRLMAVRNDNHIYLLTMDCP